MQHHKLRLIIHSQVHLRKRPSQNILRRHMHLAALDAPEILNRKADRPPVAFREVLEDLKE